MALLRPADLDRIDENASVLALLATYAALLALQVPLATLMTGFGLAIAAAITLLPMTSSQSCASARRRAACTNAGRRDRARRAHPHGAGLDAAAGCAGRVIELTARRHRSVMNEAEHAPR